VEDELRKRIDEAFDEALDQPTDARRRWARERLAAQPPVLAGVESLLDAHDRAAGILEDAPPFTDELLAPPPPPTRVGPYRILRELGRGGMGVVYLAERDDGQFRLRVAVKILDAIGSQELRRRFHAERQILASLDHPGIGRLLDGGIAGDGRPFLVMEVVEGLPLDVHCDRARLPIAARLELFCQVARAVQHAHRSLVVHRDLKPSNILVTPDGSPKLLDFGIAKLLDPALAGLTRPLTLTGVRPMTPEYASPEQVRGEPVSTANDIWALGVILHELLTGRRPFLLEGRSAAECERILTGEDPALPSQSVLRPGGRVGDPWERVSPHARARDRGTIPSKLSRILQGDLDRIVLMALRREPERRYSSAEQMAQDVERYLRGEAVLAHADTRLYRLRKFVGRHRMETTAAVLLALSLVAGAAVATWQAGLLARERDRVEEALVEAEDARDRAEDVTQFLLSLFQASSPEEAAGTDLTAVELLDRGVARAEALDDRPQVQARMLEAVGRVYQNLGVYDRARELMVGSLALRREALGPSHPDVADGAETLAQLLRVLSRFDESAALYEEALTIRQAAFGHDDVRVANVLAGMSRLASDRGNWEESETRIREALDIRMRAHGPDHPDVVAAQLTIAAIFRRRGMVDESEGLYRAILDTRRRTLGPEDPLVAEALLRLAGVTREHRANPSGAEPLIREALAIQQRARGPMHPETSGAWSELAHTLADLGRETEALLAYQEALRIRRHVYGPVHFAVGESLGQLGHFHRRFGRLAEAEEAFRASAEAFREAMGPGHNTVAGSLQGLAQVLVLRGDTAQAEALLREAREIRSATMGPESLWMGLVGMDLAELLLGQGRREEALALSREAVVRTEQGLPPGHPDILRARALLERATAAQDH
jgi:eukaryotic-like serine/threonine-protein kinase